MYDVIIIGGGIAGVSAGAELASRGRTVCVLEAEQHLGYHATGRSAAIFIASYGPDCVRALTAESEPVFRDLDPKFWQVPVLSDRGYLMVAGQNETVQLDAILDAMPLLQKMSPAEAHNEVPILNLDTVVAAAFEPNAYDIDVDVLLQGYAKKLRAHGGDIRLGVRVTDIVRDGGSWRIGTNTDRLTAPVVVNAAGGWADGIATMAGARPLGVVPKRRSGVVVPIQENFRNWPLFGDVSESWYARPMGAEMMVSPADADPVEAHDVWADDMVLAEGLFAFSNYVTIEIDRIGASWAGMRSFAPDGEPVIGFDDTDNGFFWLAGQGGYGIQTAPALSRLAAELIVSPETVCPERAALLSPCRFVAS